jgi:hypothetical protein
MAQQVHVFDAVRPAIIPATRQDTFRCAFIPHGRLIRTCPAASSSRAARWASAITGTKPAPRHTRFGSSNVAWIFASPCNNRICEVSSPLGIWKRQQLPSPQVRGHLSRRRARTDTYLHGGSRLSSGLGLVAVPAGPVLPLVPVAPGLPVVSGWLGPVPGWPPAPPSPPAPSAPPVPAETLSRLKVFPESATGGAVVKMAPPSASPPRRRCRPDRRRRRARRCRWRPGRLCPSRLRSRRLSRRRRHRQRRRRYWRRRCPHSLSGR